jgi:hypothetical protein
LQNIVDRGTNWRERERAKTLILFDDGQSMSVIAETVGIDIRTVGLTRIFFRRIVQNSIELKSFGI